MLKWVPKLARWLAWVVLLVTFLGVSTRPRIIGSGVARHRELLLGLLDPLSPVRVFDVNVIVYGLLLTIYLFLLSLSVRRMLRQSIHSAWLYLHIGLSLILVVLPVFCYEYSRIPRSIPGWYTGHLIPIVDELIPPGLCIYFRVKLWEVFVYVYGLLINTGLLVYGLFGRPSTFENDRSDAIILDDDL